MGVLENYKARVTGTVGSSLKEYVKRKIPLPLMILYHKNKWYLQRRMLDQ